jgi:hypothetical protein
MPTLPSSTSPVRAVSTWLSASASPAAICAGWRSYLCQVVDRFGERLAKLQVADEPNHVGPGGDGVMPAVRAAVVEGLVAASQHIRATGSSIQVGCNSTPIAPHADDHWRELVRLGGDFALRDANSSVDNPFFQLGQLRDNYSPKPAFAAYCQLIAELGRAELM